MNKSVKLILHLLAQIVVLSAVTSLPIFQGKAEPYYQAFAAVVGVAVAFYDNQAPQ